MRDIVKAAEAAASTMLDIVVLEAFTAGFCAGMDRDDDITVSIRAAADAFQDEYPETHARIVAAGIKAQTGGAA